MKNRIWVFLLAFGYVVTISFLWSGGVSAQTETPTPFPSFTPPPTETSTPTPTAIGQACPPDGTLEASMLTNTPSPLWLVECEHCLTIVPTGSPTQTPFPTATHDGIGTPYPTPMPLPPVACQTDDIPAIEVTEQWVNVPRAEWVRSGHWLNDAECSAYFTNIGDGRHISYTFTGTGFRISMKSKDNMGIADIYLDGQLSASVDNYDTVIDCAGSVYEVTGLADQEHTIDIYPTDTKNPASSNDYINITYIDVLTTVADTFDVNPLVSGVTGDWSGGTPTYSFDCEEWGEISIHCSYSFSGSNPSNILNDDFFMSLDIDYDGADGDQTLYVRHVQTSTGIWAWGGGHAFPMGINDYAPSWDIDTEIVINDDVGILTIAKGAYRDPTDCDCNHVELWGEVWITPQDLDCDPSIIEEVPEAGFCAAVNGGDGYSENDVFGFDLFKDDPSAQTNCNLGWEAFSFLEYTVPSVEICFQPVLFGVVKLWGEDYEVGIYGLIAAGAAIWRFLAKI